MGKEMSVCHGVLGPSRDVYDDSQWHHLAVRRKGLTLTMFVDGAVAATDTRTTGTVTNLADGTPLRLGSSAIAATYGLETTGTFDDLRVYHLALEDCDIALVGSRP